MKKKLRQTILRYSHVTRNSLEDLEARVADDIDARLQQASDAEAQELEDES